MNKALLHDVTKLKTSLLMAENVVDDPSFHNSGYEKRVKLAIKGLEQVLAQGDAQVVHTYIQSTQAFLKEMMLMDGRFTKEYLIEGLNKKQVRATDIVKFFLAKKEIHFSDNEYQSIINKILQENADQVNNASGHVDIGNITLSGGHTLHEVIGKVYANRISIKDKAKIVTGIDNEILKYGLLDGLISDGDDESTITWLRTYLTQESPIIRHSEEYKAFMKQFIKKYFDDIEINDRFHEIVEEVFEQEELESIAWKINDYTRSLYSYKQSLRRIPKEKRLEYMKERTPFHGAIPYLIFGESRGLYIFCGTENEILTKAEIYELYVYLVEKHGKDSVFMNEIKKKYTCCPDKNHP